MIIIMFIDKVIHNIVSLLFLCVLLTKKIARQHPLFRTAIKAGD